MNSIQRRRLVVSDVVSNKDLVATILKDNIGPTTFADASLVCKTWLSVCRSNEHVLRGVAQYQGGLTKGVFMNLFAVSSLEADALPRTSHKRFGGGSYYLYGKDAVNTVLKTDGMEKWRHDRTNSTYDTMPTEYADMIKCLEAICDMLDGQVVAVSGDALERIVHACIAHMADGKVVRLCNKALSKLATNKANMLHLAKFPLTADMLQLSMKEHAEDGSDDGVGISADLDI